MTFGTDRPPSLSHLFEPPDGQVGVFGWLCGYSADGMFLNAAAERFTRRTRQQRAAVGDVSIVAMLDPGEPRISPVQVPGILHLPLAPRRSGLLHAKVALLGFRTIGTADKWLVRLIVSTGNWTRQTLEESLDLAWTVELGNENDYEDSDQRAADIAAAADFMGYLRGRVLASPLEATSKISSEARVRLDKWIEEIKKRATKEPRFIDSRREALLTQILERIGAAKRNHLSIGSGFYEGGEQVGLPRVLANIIGRLREKQKLTTGGTGIDIYVQPDACQSVATAVPAICAAGITIRKPAVLSGRPRRLHAKFIFSAYRQSNSPRCTNAWLYLGSGNMTHNGLHRSDREGGNLEAGVVLKPDNLVWNEESKEIGIPICRLLPLDWEDESLVDPETCKAGEDIPDRPAAYVAPPVSHLKWLGIDGSGRLEQPPQECTGPFDVLDPTGATCTRDETAFHWQTDRPLEVRVRWQQEGTWLTEFVPVIDEYGRVAGQILPPVRIDDVWTLLADFPLPPPLDELDGDDDDGAIDRIDHAGRARDGSFGLVNSYPIRRMMELVERIAQRQCALDPGDWTAWCTRLGQTLEQAKADTVIYRFGQLGVDPLAALRAAPFRPEFALGGTREALLYEETLDRIAVAWRMKRLEPLGGRHD